MKDIIDFVQRLREASIWFRFECIRDEAIAVVVAVPGERWEVEFFEGGEVEVEVFKSDGTLHDRGHLETLFREHSD